VQHPALLDIACFCLFLLVLACALPPVANANRNGMVARPTIHCRQITEDGKNAARHLHAGQTAFRFLLTAAWCRAPQPTSYLASALMRAAVRSSMTNFAT
jgi:hypothetical protein